MISVNIQGRRTGHDDEPCDDVGKYAAGYDVEARSLVLPPGYALLHDGGLQVKLHPGRNGRAHYADHHVQVVLVEKHFLVRRYDGSFECLQPGRLRQNASNDVGQVKKRCGKKYLLYRLVLSLDHDEPDDNRADGDRVVLARPNNSRLPAMPANSVTTLPKLTMTRPIIMRKRDAQAEFLANQVAQAFAGDRAHAGAISCTTISAIVIGIIVHNSMCPN